VGAHGRGVESEEEHVQCDEPSAAHERQWNDEKLLERRDEARNMSRTDQNGGTSVSRANQRMEGRTRHVSRAGPNGGTNTARE
jgi:hypothetical protein